MSSVYGGDGVDMVGAPELPGCGRNIPTGESYYWRVKGEGAYSLIRQKRPENDRICIGELPDRGVDRFCAECALRVGVRW
jgi:hypothetical protein